jgi:hypothetical protein
VRGREAFIAQAGWPIVYLLRGEELVAVYPDTTLEETDASVLGERQSIEVRLFRAALQPGDTILMLDGPMARQLDPDRLGMLVAGSNQRALQNLQSLAPPEDCTAMVIRMPSTFAREPADQWAYAQAEGVAATGATAAASAGMERPSPEAAKKGGQVQAVLQGIGSGLRSLGESLLPDRTFDSQTRTASSRVEPQRQARPVREDRDRRPNWALVAAFAIPLATLLTVGSYTAYRNWSAQSQLNSHLEEARRKQEIALSSAGSPTVARDYWLEVLASLQAAEAMQPDHPDIAQMRSQAERELDRIDGVTRLGAISRIHYYTEPGSSPSRVAVAGLDVYVLDRGTEQVYHHKLNDLRNALRDPSADQILVQQGQTVEDATIGNLVDITWMDDGGQRQAGALLVLDRAGLLLEIDPTWEQRAHQTLGGVDSWLSPVSLHTFDGNLYILDAMANQVLRYRSGRYADIPDRWITQEGADLRTAVDMGIDGSIYLLHNNGKMDKFHGGEAVPFGVNGVPRALSGANALQMDVEEAVQYIYVADASERRIVQLDREGAFVRQLQPELGQEDLFHQLSGLFVDETGAKLYYVAANALYVTDLPPVQP